MGDDLGDDWVAEGLNSGDEGISTTVAAAGKFLIDEIEHAARLERRVLCFGATLDDYVTGVSEAKRATTLRWLPQSR